MKGIILAAPLCLLAATTALADEEIPPVHGGHTWIGHLLEEAQAKHRAIRSIRIEGAPEGKTQIVILGQTGGGAAVFTPVAHPVTASGAQRVGATTVIRRPYLSNSGHRLGTIVFTFQGVGDAKLADSIARDVARHSLSAKNAADPWPYDPAVPTNAYGQHLVDHFTAANPDILVMMLHATPPGGRTNMVIGTNIGRFGKVADEDDLRVIDKGETNLEIGGDKDRYETELPLNDASGTRIGALGIVFPLHPGENQEAIHQRGIRLRDELARMIPNSAALFQPTPGGAQASAAGPLVPIGATLIPDYTGDFDHFAVDATDGRMFLAGEEHHEVVVMDLATGKLIRRLPGYGAPHSLLYMPARGEVLVIDGEQPSRILDAKTLATKRTFKLPAGADSVGFDGGTGHLWVVTGGKDVPQPDSNLIEIDPATGKVFKSVHFDADHVEAMAVEQHGPHLFINVTDKNYLAVVDKAQGKVVAQWPIAAARQSAPIAMDEADHRLFVVTRDPGKLVVLNADTGTAITEFAAPLRVDESVWDPNTRRIYVPGGEGNMLVVQQQGADSYQELARVPTRTGAKTAVIDPKHRVLWVAASPGEEEIPAKVLRFKIVQ